MRSAWTAILTSAGVLFFSSLTWADWIGLVPRENSREVTCYSPSFHGYVDDYKDGKFRIFRVLKGCTGGSGVPRECESFMRLPKGAMPRHVVEAVPNPEAHRYLYHEFWEEDINVIAFNELYGDPCPILEIRPIPKKSVPPAISESPDPSKPVYRFTAMSRPRPEGQPLPDYRIHSLASTKIFNYGITTRDRVPITGPDGKVETQLSGKNVVLTVPVMNVIEGRREPITWKAELTLK